MRLDEDGVVASDGQLEFHHLFLFITLLHCISMHCVIYCVIWIGCSGICWLTDEDPQICCVASTRPLVVRNWFMRSLTKHLRKKCGYLDEALLLTEEANRLLIMDERVSVPQVAETHSQPGLLEMSPLRRNFTSHCSHTWRSSCSQEPIGLEDIAWKTFHLTLTLTHHHLVMRTQLWDAQMC